MGIGATILGYADIAFMSSAARLKCPFTSLGVAPEAASSYLLPQLVGRQNAAWLLMSSEWVDAEEALRMGLVWRVCDPEDLLPEARRHAEILAARPISSLMAVKHTMPNRSVRRLRRRPRGKCALRRTDGGPGQRGGARRFDRAAQLARLRGVELAFRFCAAAMIARRVRLQRRQSPPAPHAAATSLDVDAPCATASDTV